MFLLFSSLLTLSNGASSGAKICDALGICAVQSSGAYNDSDATELKCPWGMHLVGVPTRSNDYMVATADLGEIGPDSYVPGEIMDVHIRVLNPMKKFLGILIYAVQNDGVIGEYGCPSPGCDGKEETKVGDWESTFDANFQPSCDGKALTHREANIKNYHHVLRWRAPLKGSGDVIFRVILKQGSTNGGFFYWPMSSDLMLFEDESVPVASETTEWISGPIQKTCSQICSSNQKNCDRSVYLNGTTDLYDEIKMTQSCQRPLLSGCSRGGPTRDSSGFCWFENREICDDLMQPINICDSKSSSVVGSEKICPCFGSDFGFNDAAFDVTSVPNICMGVGALVLFLSCGIIAFYHFSAASKNDQIEFDAEEGAKSQGPPPPPPQSQPGFKQIEGKQILSPTTAYLSEVWVYGEQ